MTPDLFGHPVRRCSFCGKWNATLRRECNPPDDSTEVYRWWCDTTCEANWGTGQAAPGDAGATHTRL